MTSTKPSPTSPGPIEIVHAGERCVVVDKPAGLLSVPGKLEKDCVAARIAGMFPRATGPLIVHRLDMETSGLMVLALDPEAHRELSGQFEARKVEKRYEALLDARFTPGEHTPREDPLRADEGEVELAMRLDVERRPWQVIDPVQGRPARTRWRVLARESSRIRVELVPLTGRTHQLRLHAAAGLGRAILGDSLYGDRASAPRLMLHARVLGFTEPGGGWVRVERAAAF